MQPVWPKAPTILYPGTLLLCFRVTDVARVTEISVDATSTPRHFGYS